MGLIKHTALAGSLDSLAAHGGASVFLICGEPFLVRKAFEDLAKALLRGLPREFALETLDGTVTPVGDIVEQVSTFSFLQSRKVIAVKDAPLFSARSGTGEISYTAGDMVILADLVAKGIPDNHILVITTGAPDRRKKVYKLVADKGTVIDCTVASGTRKADLEEQRTVLRDLARQMLSGTHKKLDPRGFAALLDQTGFNPQIFAGNIEKLLAYTGTRQEISVQDVMAVVHRDKKDPVFSLTNAVMDRDAPRALNLLSSLFAEGFHPLQIMKTLENQVRKLLSVKCFVLEVYRENPGLPPLKTMHFNGFKQAMMPRIVARDRETAAAEEDRNRLLDPAPAPREKTGKGKPGKPLANDLLLAPNSKNPYPVFQNFLKSENFSLDELAGALTDLADLDYRVKSSGSEAVTGIEAFIMKLCTKGGKA